jgi:hypothetical protein
MTADVGQIKEWVSEWNEEALLADGFEDAIVGVCERFGAVPVVAYDKGKCIESIIARSDKNGLTDEEAYEEAVEYFEFNVIGSWVGDGTPVFLTMLNKGAGVNLGGNDA